MRNKLFVLALLLLPGIALAATISGTAFEWFSLEPIGNIIVELDTTPKQTLVSSNGSYSFNVDLGSYTLTAQYFEENVLVYEASENVVIETKGSFTIDLIMLPSLDDEFLLEDFNNLDVLEGIDQPAPANNPVNLIGGVVLVAIAFILILFGARKIATSVTGLETKHISLEEKYYKIPKKMAEALKEEPVPKEKPKPVQKQETQKPEKLDKNLQEVLTILKKYGGRLTQKELRDKLPHGEAKTSLLIAELVEMGKIKKFKQGRGNALVLKD